MGGGDTTGRAIGVGDVMAMPEAVLVLEVEAAVMVMGGGSEVPIATAPRPARDGGGGARAGGGSLLAYVQDRLTNGIVEGINNRLRTITRRTFGFHSAKAPMGMLLLCWSGIQLQPLLPGSTH